MAYLLVVIILLPGNVHERSTLELMLPAYCQMANLIIPIVGHSCHDTACEQEPTSNSLTPVRHGSITSSCYRSDASHYRLNSQEVQQSEHRASLCLPRYNEKKRQAPALFIEQSRRRPINYLGKRFQSFQLSTTSQKYYKHALRLFFVIRGSLVSRRRKQRRTNIGSTRS